MYTVNLTHDSSKFSQGERNAAEDGTSTPPVVTLPLMPQSCSPDTPSSPTAREQSHPSPHTSCQSKTQYVKLSADDKAKVENILYLAP